MRSSLRFCVVVMLIWSSVGFAADAPATQPAKPMRVGIILSKTTANELSQDRQPRGYDKQTRIVPDLKSPDIELTCPHFPYHLL